MIELNISNNMVITGGCLCFRGDKLVHTYNFQLFGDPRNPHRFDLIAIGNAKCREFCCLKLKSMQSEHADRYEYNAKSYRC